MEVFIQIYMFPSELILSAELFKAFIQGFQYELNGERQLPLLERAELWCTQGKADVCSILPQRDAAVWRELCYIIHPQHVTSGQMLNDNFFYLFLKDRADLTKFGNCAVSCIFYTPLYCYKTVFLMKNVSSKMINASVMGIMTVISPSHPCLDVCILCC